MQQQSQLNPQISDSISEPGGRLQPTHVEPVRVLGNGRAATAVLVSATDYSGRETECVEKIFAPGLLTRFIYRAFFQAPFGYQANRDAIFACYYRRRVASQLIRVFVPEAAIAEPLYVRWNPEEGAYSLAAEFIKGRGIRPAPAFTRRLRNSLPWSKTPQQDAEQGEIDELLSLMSRLETLFRESGMVGSGWQVSKSAVVSTANLLRTESGYVVVDLESGIPAILVMHYVLAGLRLKSWPLFDDVDPQGLTAFIDQNSQQIEEAIGEDGLADLRCDIDSLIAHSKAWKAAEVSMFRSGLPFLSSEFQSRYRQQTLDHWCRTGRTDSETDQRFRNSARLYSRPIYWVGMLPGGLGKGLQKLCGNREARKRFRLFCTDRDYRKHRLGGFVDRKVVQFRQEQRLESKSKPVTFGLMFLVHWILSKVTPTRVHRLSHQFRSVPYPRWKGSQGRGLTSSQWLMLVSSKRDLPVHNSIDADSLFRGIEQCVGRMRLTGETNSSAASFGSNSWAF
ncbi:hypothetical protein SV7mr_50680 [Stieleria bergensis]|uniref:Uncharacterized protein n=1 Tax=Stieleria bergensis TaxID=2528025 RepID=A0A517T2B8_9BACT|nr:hypothetical protein SV7mr_50680 [Planctomycetes bacterium SV_7m_r]